METSIREMTIGDYKTVYDLWKNTEGMDLSDADSLESITRFLKHNPGLSFVAVSEGEIVGAALCGHDGRRGYLHHLAVRKSYRRQGIGRSLVWRCLYVLMRAGISKTCLFIFDDNVPKPNFLIMIETNLIIKLQSIQTILKGTFPTCLT